MDTIVIVIIAVIVLLLACHLLSKKPAGRCGQKAPGTGCGPCETSTVAGTCYPPSEFRVKNGLFDFADCDDVIYVLNKAPSKDNFLTRA